MSDQATHRRLLRVRTGRQKTVPIPAAVLAQTIQSQGVTPLTEHLGPEMVQAIKESATLAALTEDAA